MVSSTTCALEMTHDQMSFEQEGLSIAVVMVFVELKKTSDLECKPRW